MNYPKMKKEPFVYTMANHTVSDEYILLERPYLEETRQWVKEENELTDRWFKENAEKEVKKLQEKYRGVTKPPRYSSFVKTPKGIAATRYNPDGTYTLVWLDEELKEMGEFHPVLSDDFTVFSMAPSSSGKWIALKALKDGADRPSVLIMDAQGQTVLKQLDGIFYFIWDQSGTKVIYSDAEVDQERGSNINYIRVYDCQTDTIETLYTENENAVLIEIAGSYDGKWIMAMIMQDYANVRPLAINAESYEIKPLAKKALPLIYGGTRENTHYFISYIKESMGQLIAVKEGAEIDQAEVIADGGQRMLENLIVEKSRILVAALKDACSELLILDLDTGELQPIALPDEFGALSLKNADTMMKHEDGPLYFEFESFLSEACTLKLKNNTLIPADLKPKEEIEGIKVIQKKIEVRDGTLVPCFVVYPSDLVLDGNHPALMYAYGGYNNAMLPMHENPFVGLKIVDWVRDGGIYVHINIRGGNEYGSRWHIEGMKQHKKNCFTDFIDVAEKLIEEGWTNPKKIGICGGSNGGLLMCALLTMRPDLWGCVIASVPHTDMLRFCLDDRGPMYVTEYGDPREEEMFEYMKSYSPYHNVKALSYPPVLIQTGECDNNVPPYHGKKMAARLQEYNTSIYPVLLRVLAKGSHDRGKGEVYIQTISEMQAFLKYYLM